MSVYIVMISPEKCITNDIDADCNDCETNIWLCGGINHYFTTYCVEVIAQVGDNSLGCPLPTGICSRTNLTANGTTIDWDTACGEGNACTQTQFDAFVEQQYQFRNNCEARNGIDPDCCPEPCVSMDCFCPSSTKPRAASTTTHTCEDVGLMAPQDTITIVKAKEPNTFCFQDCLCCYSEECCRDDNCRPYRFLGPGDEPCCNSQCYNGTIVDGENEFPSKASALKSNCIYM